MSIERLTASERADLLEGLRARRRADAADMAPPLGLAFASRLRTLGRHADADAVEKMAREIMSLN
jgi:hypothetical protein